MNNRIMKLSLLSIGIAFVVTQPTVVHAKNCHTPLHQSLLKIKDPNVLARTNELDLTPAQNEVFKEMKTENDKINDSVQIQVSDINKQINPLIKSPAPDQASIDKLILESKKIYADGQSKIAIIRHHLYQMLNENQKVKYTELQHQERQYFLMFLQCYQMVMDAKNKPNTDPLTHLNDLNLSPEQKAKIMPLAKSVHEYTVQSLLELDYDKMSVDRMEQEIVQSSSPVDQTKLNTFIEHQSNIYEAIEKQQFMVYHAIYHALNEQQKTQFMEMLNKAWDKQ